MTVASRLEKQIEEIVSTLNSTGAPFALIGGLALAPYKVDIDLLTDATMAEAIHHALLALGYHYLHRSPDAGNYQRADERVDLIFAHRPAARRLLATATQRQTPFGPLNIVSPEGLIGLKLQGYVNNPRRTQDLEDIRALIAANRETLDMQEVRESQQPLVEDGGLPWRPAPGAVDPFVALDDLMCVVEALCPVWPERPTFERSSVFLI